MGPASSVAGQERQQLLLARAIDGLDNELGVVVAVHAQVLVGAALQEQLGHLGVGELAREHERRLATVGRVVDIGLGVEEQRGGVGGEGGSGPA